VSELSTEDRPSIPHPAIGGIRLVFGGNVFGWTIDRDQSFEVLDAFFEAGGRMIDTAEGYSAWAPGNAGGESETIIGEWQESRGVRREILIGTKTGMGGPPGALKPENVAKALEASLERLRTDYVDLYYAHRDDLTTPLGEVVAGYDALVRAGKARELGASNYTVERLAAVVAEAERQGATPFTVLQPQYNLVTRSEYEGTLQDLCVAKGIAVLPFYGLAAGFLTGKYRSQADWAASPRGHALNAAADAGGWDVLAVMDEIARESGATHAQIALSWLNSHSGVAAAVASATSLTQLADLIAGASLELSPDQLDRLSRAQDG
jgi:aryl-alcohol dehydrogenase-like predicted oxidoreductase